MEYVVYCAEDGGDDGEEAGEFEEEGASEWLDI